jgi:quercetin dioxygenase-like cupin family protein
MGKAYLHRTNKLNGGKTMTPRFLPLLSLVLAFWEVPAGSYAQVSGGVIFQANEGDRRITCHGKSPVTIKVDPVTAGSEHFVMGMGDIMPGDSIRVHRHELDDEIIFVHKGSATVTLGDQRVTAEAGATVFIPRGTWIGMENTGGEPVTIVFLFPNTGFEKFIRSISAPEEQPCIPPTAAELAALQKEHHIEFKP